MPDDRLVPQMDVASILLACVGVGLGIAFAILAGTLSARALFDVTREREDEGELGTTPPR